jgi:hypothetical protein
VIHGRRLRTVKHKSCIAFHSFPIIQLLDISQGCRSLVDMKYIKEKLKMCSKEYVKGNGNVASRLCIGAPKQSKECTLLLHPIASVL